MTQNSTDKSKIIDTFYFANSCHLIYLLSEAGFLKATFCPTKFYDIIAEDIIEEKTSELVELLKSILLLSCSSSTRKAIKSNEVKSIHEVLRRYYELYQLDFRHGWIGEIGHLDRLEIVYRLLELSLYDPNRFWENASNIQAGQDVSGWRLEPLGLDKDSNVWWLIADRFLYQNTKKMDKWTCAASDLDSWSGFIENSGLRKSRSPASKQLYTAIKSEIYPQVSHIFSNDQRTQREEQRKREQKEKIDYLLINRKRSSRLKARKRIEDTMVEENSKESSTSPQAKKGKEERLPSRAERAKKRFLKQQQQQEIKMIKELQENESEDVNVEDEDSAESNQDKMHFGQICNNQTNQYHNHSYADISTLESQTNPQCIPEKLEAETLILPFKSATDHDDLFLKHAHHDSEPSLEHNTDNIPKLDTLNIDNTGSESSQNFLTVANALEEDTIDKDGIITNFSLERKENPG